MYVPPFRAVNVARYCRRPRYPFPTPQGQLTAMRLVPSSFLGLVGHSLVCWRTGYGGKII